VTSELNRAIYFTPGQHIFVIVVILKTCIDKELGCRIETTWCFLSLYIAFKMALLNRPYTTGWPL